MPLQRFLYTAYLRLTGDEVTEHPVEVTHGDRLRAELEADRQNLPVDPRKAPQQTTALWVWASLVRSRVVDVDYRTFRDGDTTTERPPVLVFLEQVKGGSEDPDAPAAVDVDPTSAGVGSPSSSLPASETSTDGSTLTPTNA